MSFTDDFNNCMSASGLPAPKDLFDSLADALEVLHQLHNAWENAGGDEEMTMAILLGLSGPAGLMDAAILATLTEAFIDLVEVTVSVYLAMSLACAVRSAGSSVWDAIATTDDSWLHGELVAQADTQNIPNPNAIA